MGTEKMGKQRILVVDDDPEVVRLMRGYLEQAGYDVLTAFDGGTAFQMMRAEKPDLLLLDLMLPEKDGLEVTRLIRSDPHIRHIPIIMLTAKIEEMDRILGLELGADDYVTKPYSPREVVARVKARLRSFADGKTAVNQPIREGDLELDPGRHEVRLNGRLIDLTQSEFSLLQTLMQNAGYVFSRENLITKAFGDHYEGLDRTLDSHMRNLRKKIEPNPRKPIYIHTIYGVGYRFSHTVE
jgi:two-component system alkaline phosphatase synthesis response regulator PhoP